MSQNEISPGVYDIPGDIYHSTSGLSSSALKMLFENPARYHWEYIKGNRRPETPALLTGTVLHSMLLEPDCIFDEIAVAPACDRRTKAGKELWAAFQAENAGKRVISKGDFDLARAMSDAVLSHKKARGMIEKAVCEKSVFWHEDDGTLCKCRPDAWRQDIGVVVDLKSTTSSSPRAFKKQAANLLYHLSAAWYMRGIYNATGEYPRSWAWIAVEKEPPHPVVIFVASDEMLERGSELCEAALDTYTRGIETGHWPAYTDEIVELELPVWAA